MQVSGAVNVVESIEGLQLAIVANDARRSLAGVQIAMANNVEGTVDGAQIAFLANAATRVRGLQLALVLNGTKFHSTVPAGLSGVQIAGFANLATDVQGLQVAVLANGAEDLRGMQLGTYNYTDRLHSPAFQIGLVNNARSPSTGYAGVSFSLQFGAVNFARQNTGAMIGIVDYCAERCRLQVGLLNIAWGNPIPVLPILNVDWRRGPTGP